MSLYDDVILPEFAINIPLASVQQTTNSNSSSLNQSDNKTESQTPSTPSTSDIASWSSNSFKLLQYQVEAAKKRQLTLNSASNLKREKLNINISPVVDLTDKRKPQLQLKKDPETIYQSTKQNNEIRFNPLTGKVEEDDSSSFFATLNEEYDPLKPNDYEKLVYELKKNSNKVKSNDRNSRRDSHRHKRNLSRSSSSKSSRSSRSSSRSRSNDRNKRRKRRSSRNRKPHSRHSSSSSDDDRRKRRYEDDSAKNKRSSDESSNKRYSQFAPPPSLVETDSKVIEQEIKPSTPTNKNLSVGLMKAEKMMAKMGYKEGEGLGRNNQGMSVALQVEKIGNRIGKIIHEKDIVEQPILPPVAPSPVIHKEPAPTQVGIPTEVMKNMSKVILLRNMVMPGEVDDDLEGETKEECQKYGEVNKCVIFEMPDKPQNEAVRIFVEFKTLPSAIKALTDLNGRFFGGRVVKATFYNFDKFQRLELADDV